MNFPSDRKYTKDHEWVVFADGVATVGITEFAQDELGEIVFVELPDSGAQFSAGDSLCVVESTKAASDVYSPLAGTVAESNAALTDSPELINSSPYADGWMVRFSGITEEALSGLMSADEYKAHVGA
ncbi:MAG: glycine cleavage system protein GcvH [Bdellovibrionales bacterium]|nr:glycine cleavage system protein GcvH [Bdellovibrionales bacterium]